MTTLNTKTAEKLTDDVLSLLNGHYSSDGGETFFEGTSLSNLIENLREKGWRNIGNPSSFEYHILRPLGFKMVKAQAKKPSWWGEAKNPLRGRPCNVITL